MQNNKSETQHYQKDSRTGLHVWRIQNFLVKIDKICSLQSLKVKCVIFSTETYKSQINSDYKVVLLEPVFYRPLSIFSEQWEIEEETCQETIIKWCHRNDTAHFTLKFPITYLSPYNSCLTFSLCLSHMTSLSSDGRQTDTLKT